MDSQVMQEERAESYEMNGFQKVIGVFTSPGKTFASLNITPTWILPIIIYIAVSVAFIFFAQKIIIKEAITVQQEKMAERGMTTDEMNNSLAMAEKVMKITIPLAAVAMPIIMIVVISGVFRFVGNVVMGGSATFKKVFSITAHSFLIHVLGALIILPLVLAKGSMQVSFSLAALMSDEAKGTFLYQFLAKIDLFWIWWIAVYSIGLAVIYKMRTQKMATAVVTVYGIYAVVASAISAAFS